MRKFFLITISFLTLISCGRKRVITSQGEIMWNDKKVRWEVFTERDTTFKYFYSGDKVVGIIYARNDYELKDSTFLEKDFSDDGKLIQVKPFLIGKPEGEWTSYYPNGKKKSISITKDGLLMEYRAWYDNGKAQVNGGRGDKGQMRRTEFFRNGTISQQFNMDSTGQGYCTSFFMNGKKREEGNVFNYSPIGVWKRYDSLGNNLHDTLLGIEEIKKQ